MGARQIIFTAVLLVVGLAVSTVLFSLKYLGESAADATLDEKLAKVISIYKLSPLEIRRFEADPEMQLGQALFFDPVLSGDRDVSCSTCHLLSYGLTDGLPRSIGVGGIGLGPSRRPTRALIHPRKSLSLWNRDNNAVSAFFWDGHVEVLDSVKRVFRSPLGSDLPRGFQNAMAVQSAFPITVPDEMLGQYGDRSASTLPTGQRNMPNDLLIKPHYATPHAEMLSIYHNLLDRLLGLDGQPTPWQSEYRLLFSKAYPNKPVRKLSIADVGNAVAHFEEMAFAANASPWDHYVGGDEDSISAQAKRGALIFYGKGRCAACHSGIMFSDFKYHGVGIFSRIIVNGKLVNDYGRGAVTGATEDRYQFRTPPLRNVTRSAPYFHDGSTTNLFDAIVRHLNPLARANGYNKNGSFAMGRHQIASISPVLSNRIILSSSEVDSLMAFLAALESQSRSRSEIIPVRVPSGILFPQ